MKKVTLIYFLFLSTLSVAQEHYALSSESTLQIAGTSTVHDWVVAAEVLEGSLRRSSGIIEAIKLEVSVHDIKSERGATMDSKMHKALKADQHPKISFELTETKNHTTLVGTIMIAGVAKPTAIDVEIGIEDNNLSITGEQQIIFQDFGMKPPTAMFGQIIVGDTVTVKFNLVYKRV